MKGESLIVVYEFRGLRADGAPGPGLMAPWFVTTSAEFDRLDREARLVGRELHRCDVPWMSDGPVAESGTVVYEDASDGTRRHIGIFATPQEAQDAAGVVRAADPTRRAIWTPIAQRSTLPPDPTKVTRAEE